MDKENLIGKKMLGFKFSNGPGFASEMEKFIDKEGTIIVHYNNACTVRFSKNKIWSYPYPEILEHLVEDQKEKTIEELIVELKKSMSNI
jgi:hypothetical protein